MKKTALEEYLDLPLKQYDLPHWAKFRGDHSPQSCICNAEEEVVGLIIRATEKTSIALPELEQLEYCCISDNNALTYLELDAAFPALKYLDLSDNQLTNIVLPAGFTQLDRVDLSRNKLEQVFFEGEYPLLKMIDLSGNKIKNWNVWELSKFPSLAYFYLKNNQLNDSLTTYHEGEANYLEGLKKLNKAFGDGERILNKEYKLLTVGDGKAGKTAFVNRLIHNKFIPSKSKDWDSTHAIAVKQFKNEQGLYDFDYILNVWDFGGQDIYHTTHRLFMQTNSTYLLIWNKETELEKQFIEREEGGETRQWKNRKWTYWLRYIAYLGKNSPVVMAQSHSSKKNPRPPHPDQKVIQEGYGDYFAKLIFSNMDSKPDALAINNYEELVGCLKKAIGGLKRYEYLPAHWVKIRQALAAKRNAVRVVKNDVGNNLMAYDAYYDLAEELGETAPEYLLKWLVRTGVVFYKEGLFNNQIILNQEWAIKAIYTLFNRENGFYYEISGRNGQFSGKDLQRYWKNYSLKEQQLFLSFMTSCEMCFETQEKENNKTENREKLFIERQFIAAEMLTENRPSSFADLEQDWKKDQKTLAYLQYKHSFLHFGIIQSFIARTYHFANVRQVYKEGILLRIDGISVIIEASTNEQEHNGAITIKLPKSAIAVLQRIRKEFANIHNSKEITELVSLDNQIYVNFKKLQEQQNEQQLVTICDKIVDTAPYQYFLQKEEKVESLSEEVKRINQTKRGVRLKYPQEADKIIEIKGNAPAFLPFKSKKKVKILFLSATPNHTGQLNTGKESRFKDLFKYWDDQKRFKWKEEHGVNADEFTNFIIKEKPQILHYGGHGEKEGIVLEEENLAGDILRDILKISKKTQCVVLNACYSVGIAKQVAEYVPYVVGTQGTIDDRTAIAFAKGFYMGIVADNSIEDAFELGLIKIRQKKLPDLDKLILVKGV